MVLFMTALFSDEQAPNHTLLGPYLVVIPEVASSNLWMLMNTVCYHNTTDNALSLPCLGVPHIHPVFYQGCTQLCYIYYVILPMPHTTASTDLISALTSPN